MRCSRLLLILAVLLGGCAVQPPATTPTGKGDAAAAAKAIPPAQRAAFNAALDAMRHQNWSEAEKKLTALAKQNGKLPGVYTNLGIVHYQQNKDAKAEAALRKAISLDAKRALAHNYLGMVLRRTGRFKEARAAYEEALGINPDYANACLNLGVLLDLYLGEPKSALDYYERYQKLVGKEDDQVKKWILDLKRRTAPKPAGGPA